MWPGSPSCRATSLCRVRVLLVPAMIMFEAIDLCAAAALHRTQTIPLLRRQTASIALPYRRLHAVQTNLAVIQAPRFRGRQLSGTFAMAHTLPLAIAHLIQALRGMRGI